MTKSATIRVSQAWDFLEVQWLRLDAREVLPVQGTQVQSLVRELRSLSAVWCSFKKKKKRLVGEVAKYVEKHSGRGEIVRSGLRGQKLAASLRNWEE